MKKPTFLSFLLVFSLIQSVYAKAEQGRYAFKIENSKIAVTVSIDRDGYLAGDSLFAKSDWSSKYDQRSFGVSSDAGFKMNFMWSAWSAPGKSANGDNLINVTQRDFTFTGSDKNVLDDGSKQLVLSFKSSNTSLEARIIYELGKDQFYARRKLEVRVPEVSGYSGRHYLRRMWPVFANLQTKGSIVKEGGLGQPVALKPGRDSQTGVFWGMEYPTAQNKLEGENQSLKLKIGDYYGKQIDTDWTSSNWVVIGLAPQPNIRQWFMRYVDDIRAQPVHPYVLYNSWYDLEAPQLVDEADRVMNEKNSLRSIKTLQQRLTDQRGVKLDAFVLDDGWDVYRSDWQISDKQFPHGFKPLVKQLNRTSTDLGVWFGPIGGYSHRDWRINWMKDHNYEIIGNNQLCLAGKNYHALLEKRVKDFTKNRDIGYYKWDGIQFSCSNPSHGHPVGVYSRRAVMDSVISLDKTVWNENKNAFLNITSGTWLSPWWVKYSSTIWMQGGDYGYTNIPSISQRDRAITYRDFVLYDDFKKQDSWFPIANLMTHGIIKGRLQKLSAAEPLDKFTNNALLYFARGVSMWELYVSPDLLTDAQWDVIAQGIKWAKDRFDIMKHTVMIGGDPGEGNPYGYAHFKGDRGVVIMRNPTMNSRHMKVTIDESLGLSGDADSLVVERVYPQKWISSVLASSGSDINVDLQGYETAIYEFFPLEDAHRPLLAGATFEAKNTDDGYQIKVLNVGEADGGAHFLNPKVITGAEKGDQQIRADQLLLSSSQHQPVVKKADVRQSEDAQTVLKLELEVDQSVKSATLATLLQAGGSSGSKKEGNPAVAIKVDGQPQEINKEEQQGSWGWYKIPLSAGSHTVRIQFDKTKKLDNWSGLASLWFIGHQQVSPTTLMVHGSDFEEPVLPPVVNPEGTIKHQQKLGTFRVSVR